MYMSHGGGVYVQWGWRIHPKVQKWRISPKGRADIVMIPTFGTTVLINYRRAYVYVKIVFVLEQAANNEAVD